MNTIQNNAIKDDWALYLQRWGLSAIPFEGTFGKEPFMTDNTREAMRWLDQTAVLRTIMLLHGDNGCGKSALCKHFLLQLEPKRFIGVYVPHSILSGAGLIATLVSKLGRTPKFRRHMNLQILEEFFEEANPRTVVIALDEAQNYEPAVLEEFRQLTLLNQGVAASFSLILVGDSYLMDTLKLRSQRALLSRIALNYPVQTLTHAQSAQYLDYAFSQNGLQREAFEPAAKDLLGQIGEGVMRNLNHVTRWSWIMACRENQTIISPKNVREALECVPIATNKLNTF